MDVLIALAKVKLEFSDLLIIVSSLQRMYTICDKLLESDKLSEDVFIKFTKVEVDTSLALVKVIIDKMMKVKECELNDESKSCIKDIRAWCNSLQAELERFNRHINHNKSLWFTYGRTYDLEKDVQSICNIKTQLCEKCKRYYEIMKL
jgi:hypothetical protein